MMIVVMIIRRYIKDDTRDNSWFNRLPSRTCCVDGKTRISHTMRHNPNCLDHRVDDIDRTPSSILP